MKSSLVVAGLALGAMLCAQDTNAVQNGQAPNSQQNQSQEGSRDTSNPDGSNPIFRVQVVSRTVQAVSYRNRSGWTRVDFQGTALAPKAKGQAEANSRPGYIQVKASVKGLPAASSFGNEYLTYVLWAVTPDGRPKNLGELLLDKNGNADIDVTTELQSFGLIVTAEPYFAVSQPSDVVVMENVIRKDTVGKYEEVNAKYELLPRGTYVQKVGSGITPMQINKDVPLELYEARNAVRLSKAAGADQLATSTFQNASDLLQQAEAYQARKAGRKPVTMTSRESVQKAEDARLITVRRQREIAMQDAKDRAAASKAAAEAAAHQQQLAEQQAQVDNRRRQEAEQAKAEADAARAQAAADAAKAQQAQAEAEKLRQQAENERNSIRQQMLSQLNQVMATRETARGLIMNMSDVLFDFGKYTLKPDAQVKLAKVSGILLAHPGLTLQVEGYTDNVGSDQFNQKLSEQRAAAVQDFLVSQGIAPGNVSAKGFGKNNPIASNDSAQGRSQNRRVQIVVSGAGLGNTAAPGTQDGQMPSGQQTPNGPAQNAPAPNGPPPPNGSSENGQPNTGAPNPPPQQ
jgi:outer membrane protein OmpA-like peptidoglycan-associated protein